MKFFTTLFSACLLLAATLPVMSQTDDDPNRDQLPRELRERKINSAAQQDVPMSAVVTINNWDNFNLATDFGEGNIATNPAQPTWFFTAYNTNAAHRSSNGHDWQNSVPNFGTTMQGDPVVAYDSLGNLFYENMFGSSSILGVKVMKSTDNGTTWGPSVTAVSGVDKNWLACDQTSGPYANYIYTCMTTNSGGAFARSTDHGATFQTTFNPSTQSLPGMMTCVGAYGNVQGGSVYVVTNSGNSFASVYTFYRSLDGGQNFTQMSSQSFAGYVGTNVSGRNSVQGMRTRPYPMITADNSYGPNRGRLYLVYASNDPPGSGNKPDIWLRYSDDGGSTWSTSKKVNDDVNPNSHHQWHPATWCDKETGKLYIQWMDTRDCPTNDSALIYATYSSDGGVTFVPNQQISNKKMKIDCPSCGGGGTPRYQGDYNGVISNSRVSMLNWTDFRNGTFMSATAYFPDFAMSIDKSQDTLYFPIDSTIVNVSVPEVKLYADTVVLSGYTFPEPTAGSIQYLFHSGNTITAFPGSKPCTIKLLGDVPVGNYQAWIEAKGPNGTPVHRRMMTIKVQPGENVYVDATANPTELCEGTSTQLNAAVVGGSAPYTYSWTPASGVSNPAIANPSSTPLTSGWFKVVVTDAAFHTGSDSVFVTVNSAPETPGTISGNTVVCIDSSANYSIDPVTGATSYSWTVPVGATINSGQNTTMINVTWNGGTGGNISVIAGNACGNSNPNVSGVAVVDPPVVPEVITGPSFACSGANVIFTIDPVQDATSYVWTAPADAFIIDGQGTTEVTIQWGTTEGDVTAVSVNACGMSDPQIKAIGIEAIPGSAGAITGPDTVCQNHGGYIYSVADIDNATSYIWILPAGASITSGDGTKSITVSFDGVAETGVFSVSGHNTCGNGTPSVKTATVKNCTGINERGLSSIKVYPNPATETVTVSVKEMAGDIDFFILSTGGQVLSKESWKPGPGEFSKQINMSGYARGVYYLKFINKNEVIVEKLILR